MLKNWGKTMKKNNNYNQIKNNEVNMIKIFKFLIKIA